MASKISLSAMLSATAGGSVISLSGTTVYSLEGGDCVVSVDVTSATAGTYENVTGQLTSSDAGSPHGTASDTLFVGDSLHHDIAGASAAGLRSVRIVEDGIATPLTAGLTATAEPDWQIKQLTELVNIVDELNGVQGSPVDIGGYFQPDDAKADPAMRPSATLNEIISSFIP